jgi:hypothetical protein
VYSGEGHEENHSIFKNVTLIEAVHCEIGKMVLDKRNGHVRVKIVRGKQ